MSALVKAAIASLVSCRVGKWTFGSSSEEGGGVSGLGEAIPLPVGKEMGLEWMERVGDVGDSSTSLFLDAGPFRGVLGVRDALLGVYALRVGMWGGGVNAVLSGEALLNWKLWCQACG